jgi:serine/threonine-protein kinase
MTTAFMPLSAAPERVGDYEIVGRIGQGPSGVVYSARRGRTEPVRALKVLAGSAVARPAAWRRFQRDARWALAVVHPGLVAPRELGEADGVAYVVTDRLDGMSLAEAIPRLGAVPVARRVGLAVAAARALDHAHKRGVIHGALKPSNLRLLADGTVLVFDFATGSLPDWSEARDGVVPFAPTYVAPECLAGERVDHRTDVWSLGAILHELLSGRPPFVAPSEGMLARRILREGPPVLALADSGLPSGLPELVARALAPRPRARFLDFGEMAFALEALFTSPNLAAAPLRPDFRDASATAQSAEARRRMTHGDFEAALEAARRAQALEPDRPDVVALVDELEDRTG